jgi:hypothetical protein
VSITKAAKAAYDRERYLRLGPRAQKKDPVAKAEYDRARYAALYHDQRRDTCAREGCASRVVQPPRGRRLYCSNACRSGAFYGVHASTREPMTVPYVGHQWFDAARKAVGPVQFEFGLELLDRYNDELGVAVLALLEGGNPKAAVIEFRKREYVPRYLTASISEWQGDADQEYKLDRLPSVPSAEDTYIASLPAPRWPRIHMGASRGFMGTPRQASPSNRRSNVA